MDNTIKVKNKDGIISAFLSIFRNNEVENDIENDEKLKTILEEEKKSGATNRIEELTKFTEKYMVKEEEEENIKTKNKVNNITLEDEIKVQKENKKTKNIDKEEKTRED